MWFASGRYVVFGETIVFPVTAGRAVFGETIVFPVNTAGRAVQAHTTLQKVTFWGKSRPFGGIDHFFSTIVFGRFCYPYSQKHSLSSPSGGL